MKDSVHVRCSRAWCERLIKLVLTDYRRDRSPKGGDEHRSAPCLHESPAARERGDAQLEPIEKGEPPMAEDNIGRPWTTPNLPPSSLGLFFDAQADFPASWSGEAANNSCKHGRRS